MKQYFTEQLKKNPPKLFYFVMVSSIDVYPTLTMMAIDTNVIDTLSDSYTYVEQRNNFPVFVKK